MSSVPESPRSLANPHVPDLHPYVPGKQPTGQGWTKLNTNELPYPASPRVAEAVAAECERLPLYPSPNSQPLRDALASHWDLDSANVFVGNGSDEVLALLVRIFSGQGRKVGMLEPSYSLYPVLTAIQDSELVKVPFERDFKLPVDAIASSGANLFFLTSPNAPSGVGFSTAAIRQIAERFSGILVVDEAYADFAEENAIELVREFPRMVVTRTFSKSYGLAGIRVGYALASPENIGLLDRVRDSYNVNRLSQAGALAALLDDTYFRETAAKVKATRAAVTKELEGRGWFVYPSSANFIFAEPVDAAGNKGPEVAERLFNYLETNHILVRRFPKHALTASFLRVTIGNEAQMQRFLECSESWLNHDKQQ